MAINEILFYHFHWLPIIKITHIIADFFFFAFQILRFKVSRAISRWEVKRNPPPQLVLRNVTENAKEGYEN